MVEAEAAATAAKTNWAAMVCRDTSCLAPKVQTALAAALAECHANGYDAVVYESKRTNELQAHYYDIGVSRVASAEWGWHFFCLAVDVISKSKEWDAGDAWWHGVATIFKAHGFHWGGDWHSIVDKPHMQWYLVAEHHWDPVRYVREVFGWELGQLRAARRAAARAAVRPSKEAT